MREAGVAYRQHAVAEGAQLATPEALDHHVVRPSQPAQELSAQGILACPTSRRAHHGHVAVSEAIDPCYLDVAFFTSRRRRKPVCFHSPGGLPGNDYTRIEHFTFDECAHSCDLDTKCNAFTYNQLDDVCFLKTAVNQWVQFYAWSITGVKLSQGLPNE